MDVAFVVDPLHELKAYKDSSIAMMRALARRGHRAHAILQPDLCWEAGRTSAIGRELTLLDDPRPAGSAHVVLDGGLALQETQCLCDGFHDRLLLMPFACVWYLPSVGCRDATGVGSC